MPQLCVGVGVGNTRAVNPALPLPALTGLRFFAALHVALYHAVRPLLRHADDPLTSLMAAGPAAVTLFFVLSGFVLVHSATDVDHVPLRPFLAARFARIVPVYLLALVLVVPLGIAARARGLVVDPLGGWSLALVATGLQAFVPDAALRWNAPAWSVSCELFFYALLPFVLPLLARLPRRALARSATVAWVLGLVAPVLYLVVDPDGLHGPQPGDDGLWLHVVQFNPLLRLPDFIVGVVVGWWWRRGGRLPTSSLSWAALAAIFGTVVVAGVSAVPRLLVHNGLLAPLFAVMILAFATTSGPLTSLLSSAPAVRLGEASYALYLLHVPAMMWATAAHKGRLEPAVAVVVVLATIPVGLVLNVLFERPLRGWLRSKLMPTSAIS